MSYIPANFTNRWVITGTLTTDTPMCIGGGETVTRPGLINEKDRRPVQVKAVFTDHQGRACLPGSSLRGVLRERLAALLGKIGAGKQEQHEIVLKLFGKPEPRGADERARRNQSGHGGLLAVHDALVVPEPWTQPGDWHPPAFWDARRRTGVTSSVAIDRRTRTAAAQKLFHTEFVPPGVTFAVRFTGDNLNNDEIGHLLRALEEFKPDTLCPLTLGADAGNGCGRLVWHLGEVRRMDAEEVRSSLQDWLANPAGIPAGGSATREIVPPVAPSNLSFQSGVLLIPASIRFEGQFLVKQTIPPKQRQARRTKRGRQDFDALPRLDSRGQLLLPAASIRGALRSRAERILRTLGVAVPDLSRQPERLEDGDSRTLSLTAQIFGATGWKAAFECSDFVSSRPVVDCSTPELARRHADAFPDAPRLYAQDFVAIDRFSGGVAFDQMPDGTIKGRKFDTKFAWEPVLHGSFHLRIERAPKAAWGLLALTLHDMLDGDMTFGMASAKGYGDCRAESDQLMQWIDSQEIQEAISAFQAACPSSLVS